MIDARIGRLVDVIDKVIQLVVLSCVGHTDGCFSAYRCSSPVSIIGLGDVANKRCSTSVVISRAHVIHVHNGDDILRRLEQVAKVSCAMEGLRCEKKVNISTTTVYTWPVLPK